MENQQRFVQLAAEGDSDAFRHLYDIYRPRIYGVLAKRTHDPDLIDDLVQTTFYRAFRSLKAYRAEAAFGTWLTQIALNVHRSHLRAERVRRRWIQEMEDPELAAEIDRSPGNQEAPDHVVVRKQQRELVRKGIEALPTRYRKVVWLRYVKDSSYEEIMQSVQVPMGTVKTWLSRGRHQLKGELRRMGL